VILWEPGQPANSESEESIAQERDFSFPRGLHPEFAS
jgi:hypothetical protein